MNISIVGVSPYLLKNSSAHSHDEWEIILNLEGQGTVVIGDREHTFYPGTIICIPPDTLHVKSTEEGFKDIFIRAGYFPPFLGGDIPVFTDDEEKSFESLMFLALRIFHKKEANHNSVLASVYETMCQMLFGWSVCEPKDEYVELFENELIKNFSDPEFNLSKTFEKTPYCADHFRRRFKKNTGTTPGAYLLNLRIDYAKRLLHQKSDNKMTISEIAFLSGFYDQRYFSRMFKNIVGLSPRDYAGDKPTNTQNF